MFAWARMEATAVGRKKTAQIRTRSAGSVPHIAAVATVFRCGWCSGRGEGAAGRESFSLWEVSTNDA